MNNEELTNEAIEIIKKFDLRAYDSVVENYKNSKNRNKEVDEFIKAIEARSDEYIRGLIQHSELGNPNLDPVVLQLLKSHLSKRKIFR